MLRTNSFVLISALVSILVTTSANATVPFEDKFNRQRQPQYKGGHVFKPGETVQGAFTPSQCEGLLSLTVAEGVKSGVGDIRHADTFQLVDVSPQDQEKLKDWRGMSFLGTVEIVSAIDRGFTISNMFEYKARLVQLEAPLAKVNPSPSEISKLEKGTEIIIFGKVSEVEYSEDLNGRRFVTLQTPKHNYNIKLWSGIPVLESDLSNKIKNLTRDDRLQVGDEVQLKVYRDENGGIGTHWCRSCQLDNPSPRRHEAYLAERRKASELIAQMKVSVNNNYFHGFRNAHAQFMKISLTPTELIRHQKLWLKLPEQERPLRLTESRYQNATILKALGVDLDILTMKEFKDLCWAWARMEKTSIPSSRGQSLDESYLYRVMQDLQLPREEVAAVARATAESRLSHFIKRSNGGLTYDHKIDWRETYNFERGMTYSTHSLSADTVTFLIETVQTLTNLEKSGWGYSGQFLSDAIRALEHLTEDSFATDTLEAKDARAELILRKGEIETIYNILQNIPAENPNAGQNVIVIGMPTPPKPTNKQRKSQFAHELRTLSEILARI